MSHACKGCNLTCPRAAVLGTNPFWGTGVRLCGVLGQKAGVSRQAGRAPSSERGGSSAVPVTRSSCVHPTLDTALPPSVGKQRGFSLLGLMRAAHLKSPVTSLVPGGLKGKHHLLVPPPARRREGEDWGLPEGGALRWPGRAWPLHPPGPVTHLLGGRRAGPRYLWFLQGACGSLHWAGDLAGPGRFSGSKGRFDFYLIELGQRPSWKSTRLLE